MEIANWNNVAVLTSTVDSAIDAERLAQTAVQARVAACVQIEAIHSHYEWQGSLERSAEWRLVFKTLPEAVDELLAWLKAEHPYEGAAAVAAHGGCASGLCRLGGGTGGHQKSELPALIKKGLQILLYLKSLLCKRKAL